MRVAIVTDMPPRWEWRTFAPNLAELEARIGLAAQLLPRQSEELYLVNAASPHNAKIRGALLDVKRLKITAATGLELWDVALKQGFPLSTTTIASFFAALDLPPPVLRRRSYSLEQFLAEIIGGDGAFRIVKAAKARRQSVFAGCRAELVRLSIGRSVQESFCIEDESPERVEAALGALGLDPAANTNYPKFLKRFTSLEA
jgi:exopolyphosphatase/guanosine-5'-triphosphate,3'-diphosphate pyrophosphatase